MKFKKIAAVTLIFMLTAIPFLAFGTSAEESESESSFVIPADTPVTYGYLEKFKEELREEIIEELLSSGGIDVSEKGYKDITLTEGKIIILRSGCEVIFRGGSAAAITSSASKGDGLTDISAENKELFSGEPLRFGHIYYPSETQSQKAITVTGKTASFTLRGDYEIR